MTNTTEIQDEHDFTGRGRISPATLFGLIISKGPQFTQRPLTRGGVKYLGRKFYDAELVALLRENLWPQWKWRNRARKVIRPGFPIELVSFEKESSFIVVLYALGQFLAALGLRGEASKSYSGSADGAILLDQRRTEGLGRPK